jgi:hypothetical protein
MVKTEKDGGLTTFELQRDAFGIPSACCAAVSPQQKAGYALVDSCNCLWLPTTEADSLTSCVVVSSSINGSAPDPFHFQIKHIHRQFLSRSLSMTIPAI